MKKALNLLLLASFVLTLLVPLTGVVVHKLASTLFLLLCLVHLGVYRRRAGARRAALLGLVLLTFGSGVAGIILETMPLVLALHKILSLVCVFCLAIHLFVCARGLRPRKRT